MKALKTNLLVIILVAVVMAWAQNGVPQLNRVDQLNIVGSDIYDFIIINNDSAYFRVGYPDQVIKVSLATKQTEWIINMNSSFNVLDALVKTPDNNLCYADGGMIVKLSTQGDTLWTRNLSDYGNFSLSASSPDFLTCYSTSSHLVLLEYTTGQIINHWPIITGGLASCGYHNTYAASDSTFYLFNEMPMGVLYNTGVKLTKLKIINGLAETVWFLQIDDLLNINGLADGNIIYFSTRQVDPWTNSLVYRVIDQGASYTVESITDIAGPDSVGFIGSSMAIDNHHLILPVAIRLGSDPNGEDGYRGATMAYNQGNLVWQIDQAIMPFFLPLAVAIDSNKVYTISSAREIAYGPRTFWLTEISWTVANDDPTTPAIPDTELSCYPNPFRGSITVKFSQIDNSPTTVSIYNAKGQLISTLVNNQKLSPGEHTVAWNGKTNFGQPVAAGIYFYKMSSGRYSSTKKMIMMK